MSHATPTSTLLRAAAQRSDRILGTLLAAHLPLALALAPLRSTWVAALVVGGGLSLLGLWVARRGSGATWSRFALAAAFMGYSALIIHQSGGMIEMHFHIFASLAFLLMYRDWRVPTVAAAVIAVHHVVVHGIQSGGGAIYVFPVGEPHSWWLVCIHAAFVVYEVVVLFFLARTLAREAVQSETLVRMANRMGQGDLSMTVEGGEGPVGVALTALGAGTARVADMIRVIRTQAASVSSLAQALQDAAMRMGDASGSAAGRAEEVRTGVSTQLASVQGTEAAVGQLKAAIGQVSSGARSQAREAGTVSAALGEMVRAMEEVSSLANAVSARSNEAGQAAQQGAEVVERTVQGMHRIRETVTVSAQQIEELETRSAQIESILKDLSDIAEQTNLLALNATIEAARAGEHGKGFAVVAAEVRELAKRADRSGEEIGDRLKMIREGTAEAVESMQACTQEVEHGTQRAGEAGGALTEIRRAVDETARDVLQIHGSATELASSGHQVLEAIQSVADLSADSSAAAEQMDSGSDQVAAAVEGIIELSRSNADSADAMTASVGEIDRTVESLRESATGLGVIATDLESEVGRFAV